MVPLTFEVQHGIDHVLKCLRASQATVLRHVPDEEYRDIVALGSKQQLGCGLAHLSDAAGRGLQFERKHGLDGVDDHEGGLQPRGLGENLLETGFGQQVEGRAADAESFATRLDLVFRLLAEL